jgi:SAM-dependent methyltransferase
VHRARIAIDVAPKDSSYSINTRFPRGSTLTVRRMDADTLAALRQSIKKWDAILAGTATDVGDLNCALCQKFLSSPNFCEGCPVKTRTGHRGCRGAPYEDWVRHHEREHLGGDDDRPFSVECGECRRLAAAQLAFLRGLLPPKGLSAADHLRWWLKRGLESILDLLHGVDTAAGASPEEDEVVGVPCAHAYDPAPWRTLKRSLQLASLRPEKFTFVDIGCGKGRVLLSALTLPFVRVIGVELSPALSKIAEQNVAAARLIARRCSSIQVICADATQFAMPDGPNILFFYNPFYVAVLENVLGKVARSYLDNPRSVFLIFYACSSILPKISDLLTRNTDGRARLRVAANIGHRSVNIFELPPIGSVERRVHERRRGSVLGPLATAVLSSLRFGHQERLHPLRRSPSGTDFSLRLFKLTRPARPVAGRAQRRSLTSRLAFGYGS